MPPRHSHHRWSAFIFKMKTLGLCLRRSVKNFQIPVTRHQPQTKLLDSPISASHRSFLWHVDDPGEMELAAGKVENLRLALPHFHGIEVRAGETFSFWKQLGRTSRARGFVRGRELREGCLIPNRGGGLCQLSNALYDLALQASFEILERHAHTKVIAGSLAEKGRDATVFWNYVDLQFRDTHDWRLEASLSKDHLILHLRSVSKNPEISAQKETFTSKTPADSLGNCLTCQHSACFRSQTSTSRYTGQQAFLLDRYWPEFDEWCAGNRGKNTSLVCAPIISKNRPNYAWQKITPTRQAHFTTLFHAYKMRSAPPQGAQLQYALLARDRALAKSYARRLRPDIQHLVISQNLLPHLVALGVLGGRTYDVLMVRWPLFLLQKQLNEAAEKHPKSETLSDFRAPSELLELEKSALAEASHLVTPHQALAAALRHEFPSPKIIPLEWHREKPTEPHVREKNSPLCLFFPASPLARKGIHELTDAIRAISPEQKIQLQILGRAREKKEDLLTGIDWKQGAKDELTDADLVVLPAWVEHSSRHLLKALAHGIPVIATSQCGLPPQKNLTLLARPADLKSALGIWISENSI